MQLSSFERDAERLLGALVRSSYLHLSGFEATLPLRELFERYAEEPWPEIYAQLHDLPLDPRQRDPLLDLTLSLHLEDRTARATARLYETEAAATIVWRDETIPLRAVPLRLAKESDRDRRHEIEALTHGARERLRPLELECLLGRRAALDELQLTNELSARATLRGLDLDALSELARIVLELTAELYADALRDQIVHQRLEGDVWESDLAWILRGTEYDATYPSGSLVPALLRTLRRFGIRLEEQGAIRLDRDARPLKLSDAFCAPIAVPDEIVAVTTPFGGRQEYADLFEQVGVAERHAHVDRTQPLALRRLGDPAVIQAYGLLFRRLTGDPAWLLDRLEADTTRDAARLAAFEHLVALRRAAAEWVYVRELLAAEEPDALGERYAELMSDALGIRAFSSAYLTAGRDPLRGPNVLRAAMLAQQFGMFLAGEFEETWFDSDRAGRFVVDRWREGQRYTAEEMARFLGFDGLDPRPLIESLRAALVD